MLVNGPLTLYRNNLLFFLLSVLPLACVQPVVVAQDASPGLWPKQENRSPAQAGQPTKFSFPPANWEADQFAIRPPFNGQDQANESAAPVKPPQPQQRIAKWLSPFGKPAAGNPNSNRSQSVLDRSFTPQIDAAPGIGPNPSDGVLQLPAVTPSATEAPAPVQNWRSTVHSWGDSQGLQHPGHGHTGVVKNRNFFGVDRTQCVDEWAGFCPVKQPRFSSRRYSIPWVNKLNSVQNCDCGQGNCKSCSGDRR